MSRRPTAARLGLLVPASLVVIGLIAAGLLVPGAAAQIAVHWDFAGRPDGFSTPASVVALIGLVGGGITVIFATILLLARSGRSSPSPVEKLLAALSSGAVALISGSGVWTLATQRGAAATSAAGVPVPAILLAVALAVTVWVVLPPATRQRPVDPVPVAAVPLTPTERAVWMGRARMPLPAILAIGSGVVVLLVGMGVAVLANDGAAWPVLVVPAGIGVFLLGLSSYTVRVDDGGLSVRAVLGLPVWRISADRVEVAGVVEVNALAEFGGWGIRLGRGRRTGVVTRSGEALQVRRRDGRALVVTVDDAATAAALLTAVAARAAQSGER